MPLSSRIVRPLHAVGFYPGDPGSCRRQARALLAAAHLPDGLPELRLGGLVPHAGWRYSGLTAAHLFRALAEASSPPRTVVLLGAVHVHGVRTATLWDGDAWGSPLGDVEVDRELATAVLEAARGAVVRGRDQHEGEHSLEVQIPLLQQALPHARVLPVAVPADERAGSVGRRIAEALAQREDVAVVASSDLTHYGPRYGFAPVGVGPEALAWSRRNDDRLVHQALQRSPAGVLQEARERHNACGSGALAACIAAVNALGATESVLLHQCTSADSVPDPKTDLFVGYAAVLFGR